MRGVESKMKISAALVLLASFLYIAVRVFGIRSPSQRTASFVGEIMDSKCSTTGSHDPIMTQLGAKDARDCTLKCAKDGSFDLYDSDTKTHCCPN